MPRRLSLAGVSYAKRYTCRPVLQEAETQGQRQGGSDMSEVNEAIIEDGKEVTEVTVTPGGHKELGVVHYIERYIKTENGCLRVRINEDTGDIDDVGVLPVFPFIRIMP